MSDTIIGSLTSLGGRYEIGELIGRGGMAEVYRGTDTRLDRNVAIKLLRPELSLDQQFRSRFRQEAQAAARMSHPTVVRVFDAGEERTTDSAGADIAVPYIVMEYVDGRMVKDTLEDGPLPESEAVRITSGILTALEYSHRAGVIHRDIKPGNVMVTPGGQVKVMDFGIARAVSETSASIAETGTILGTAQYFSPEQARGDAVDMRTDLYSAGVLLFELLTGRAPFRGDSAVAVAYRHVSEPPPAPSSIVAGITPAMDSVVLKALAKSPDDRFQSAGEFREALDAALHGVAVDVAEDDPTMAFNTPEEGPGEVTSMFAAIQTTEHTREPTQSRPPIAWMWAGIAFVGVLLIALVVWTISINNGFNFAGVATEVPSVVGLSEEEAIAELDAAGLGNDIRTVIDDADPGTVLRVSPDEGVRVAPDSTVTLVVSNGPAPRPLVSLANLTQEQAKTVLDGERLEMGTTTREDSPTVPEGQVIRSEPQAGTPVTVGTTIDLIISTGKVKIPDVVGLSLNAAVERLRSPEVGYNVEQYYVTSCMGGRVIEQSLTPGSHPQGGTIRITYCNGQPPPPPSPSAPASPSPSDGGGDNGTNPPGDD